jgi:hypothetical protein
VREIKGERECGVENEAFGKCNLLEIDNQHILCERKRAEMKTFSQRKNWVNISMMRGKKLL